MMLNELIAKIKSLKANADKIAIDTLKKLNSELEDAQIDQMEIGQNSEGEIIGRYRNPAYARFKQARGSKAPSGVVDLKLTGDFYRGVFANITRKEVVFDSTDDKKSKLQNKYGKKIFSLNGETIQKFNSEHYRPLLVENLEGFIRG